MAKDSLKLFEFYNIDINRESNGHVIGTCYFCGKKDHFYINIQTQCWDCKSCMKSGNAYGFLKEMHEISTKKINSKIINILKTDRRLPEEAFEDLEIGYNAGNFLIPYYNEFHKICNVGVYSTSTHKLIKSPTIPLTIFNLHELYNEEKQNDPVYICEGEWDAIALRWLLKRLQKPGIVIGMPGAGTFKLDWIDYFHNKVVYVCYDNDEAGFKGLIKVGEYIGPIVQEIKYINWPKNLKKGYDVRDLIVEQLKIHPNNAYLLLHSYLSDKHPLDIQGEELKKNTIDEPQVNTPQEIITYEEVIEAFRSWLDVDENFEDAIKLSLATVISTQIPGSDPLWLFLVGPPGCGKSAILSSLKEAKKYTDFQSTLSSTALISGWVGKKGTGFDPSLIPKLNGKCLVLKDFTEILKKNRQEVDTIFGILRGAYDGHCERIFGQGTKREYKSMFSIVAGTTREIYATNTTNVGERFLKFNMLPKNIDNYDRQEMAMESALFGDSTKRNVVDKVTRFLHNPFDISEQGLRGVIPVWFRKRIAALAKLIATVRTQVIRYEKGILQYEPVYKPQPESGNRLSVQFQRLGIALALVENKNIDENIYGLIKKVALYTVNDYTIDILKSLIKQTKPLNIKSMEEITGLSFVTVKAYIQDMLLLDMLEKHITLTDNKPSITYMIKDNIRQMYLDADL